MKIDRLKAREVLDSRGFPTVEVELQCGKFLTRAIAPSGASTGAAEALEIRDGDLSRYLGKGVEKVLSSLHEIVAPTVEGKNFSSLKALDESLIHLDGTPNKSKLGANAILPLSLAFTRALALNQNEPLYKMIALEFDQGENEKMGLPVPLMNILNGGKHADNGLAIQEFMIVPLKFPRFSESLRAGVEVFHHLKTILHKEGLSTGVGDEGGFAPQIVGERMHEKALEYILRAIEKAGYVPGQQIHIALDAAASEFHKKEGYYVFEDKKRSSAEMVEIYSQWLDRFPILSIEDGLAETDWTGWVTLTQRLGSHCQIVGDDLFVTNPNFLKKGIDQKAANSILIKLNQIGTVTETLDTMRLAKNAKFNAITSHRSGETEDTFIADLAVGTNCGQIKTGSACRTDRMAKYNQLLRIEQELGDRGTPFGSQFPVFRAKH